MGKGDTALNAFLGAIVTWVGGLFLSLVPVVGTALGIAAGGATAAYLQESHDSSVSIKVGALAGVIASVPAVLFLVLAVVLFSGAGFMTALPIGFAGLGAGLLLLTGLVFIAITVGVSALGGLAGQYLHERD